MEIGTTSNLKPKQLLRELSRKAPRVWDHIKSFRKAKGKDLPDWPDWCYVPLAAGYSIASDIGPAEKILFDPILNPASITALATWRVSQGVYRFDADLFNILIDQPFEGNLPCDVLKRLPEWCVYIETNGLNIGEIGIEGFFAHLESDANNGRTELRLLCINSTGFNMPLVLHLGDWTIEESLQRTRGEAAKNAKSFNANINLPPFGKTTVKDLSSFFQLPVDKNHVDVIAPFLQLVLYLCAENADIPVMPNHPNTRIRMSGQVDVPKEVRVWTVGERIGASIRKYRNEEAQRHSDRETSATHASPRPHIRRAHWHHFRTGPKTGEQKLILHWLPPIPVGYEDEQDSPVVIHKIKSPRS